MPHCTCVVSILTVVVCIQLAAHLHVKMVGHVIHPMDAGVQQDGVAQGVSQVITLYSNE